MKIDLYLMCVYRFPSAEVVASMISAEIKKAKWTTPSWLPDRYLTWTRSGPK